MIKIFWHPLSIVGGGGGRQPYIIVEVEDAKNNCGHEGPIPQRGGTAQKLEPQFSGLCNTLTSVQKDNLVLEIEDDTERDDPASHQSRSD